MRTRRTRRPRRTRRTRRTRTRKATTRFLLPISLRLFVIASAFISVRDANLY